jgi:hypothetical protein
MLAMDGKPIFRFSRKRIALAAMVVLSLSSAFKEYKDVHYSGVCMALATAAFGISMLMEKHDGFALRLSEIHERFKRGEMKQGSAEKLFAYAGFLLVFAAVCFALFT